MKFSFCQGCARTRGMITTLANYQTTVARKLTSISKPQSKMQGDRKLKKTTKKYDDPVK